LAGRRTFGQAAGRHKGNGSPCPRAMRGPGPKQPRGELRRLPRRNCPSRSSSPAPFIFFIHETKNCVNCEDGPAAFCSNRRGRRPCHRRARGATISGICKNSLRFMTGARLARLPSDAAMARSKPRAEHRD
jgi:hypothetical protein